MEKIIFLINLAVFTPGVAKAKDTTNTDFGVFSDIGAYISSITAWVYPVLGSLALVMFIYAGYLYFTSRGDTSQIDEAKNIIIGVIVGILLLFTVEILLNNVIGIR